MFSHSKRTFDKADNALPYTGTSLFFFFSWAWMFTFLLNVSYSLSQ